MIFVENPSLLLSLVAVYYGRVTGTPVVVDAHNAGLRPLEGRVPWMERLASHLLRLAPLTIVTNKTLARLRDRQIANWSGATLTIHDLDALKGIAVIDEEPNQERPLM